jgi:hypothetical protein
LSAHHLTLPKICRHEGAKTTAIGRIAMAVRKCLVGDRLPNRPRVSQGGRDNLSNFRLEPLQASEIPDCLLAGN